MSICISISTEPKFLTPIETMLSSGPEGNLTMNFEPVFSSESFNGLKRQMTLMESSVGSSFSSLFLSPMMWLFLFNVQGSQSLLSTRGQHSVTAAIHDAVAKGLN